MKGFAASLALAFFGLGTVTMEAKDTGCTLADFKGTYGFTVTGTIEPGLNISGEFGRLGNVIADGAGYATSVTTADYHGVYQIDHVAGPYTVSDGCYIQWTIYLTSIGGFVSFEGAFTGSGQVQIMVANPAGDALSGFLEKQKDGGCTAGDLTGTYALNLTGEVEPGLPISGPFGRFGQIVFDGSKVATATTVASYNGAILRENFTGPYEVRDDCHLIFRATLPPPAGFPITLEGVLSTDNSHVLMMVTAPAGAVILGEMTKQ